MRKRALSKRELRRAGVLARVKSGELRIRDGAELMQVSYRQAKRLWKRHREGVAATMAAQGGNRTFHDWCQGRVPKACLMNMVDDATSTVEALLGDGETIWAAARVLRQWIRNNGVPLALYTDWKVRKKRGAEALALTKFRPKFLALPLSLL